MRPANPKDTTQGSCAADRWIVLKLGGSVLRDEASLTLAVLEVERFLREGLRVVAVV